MDNENPDENDRPEQVDEEEDSEEGIRKRMEIAAYFMNQVQLSDED